MEWSFEKPKHEQEVWVVHNNDPVRAIFYDIGTLGFYWFVDYGWNCSAYKCGPWMPYTDEKPVYEVRR